MATATEITHDDLAAPVLAPADEAPHALPAHLAQALDGASAFEHVAALFEARRRWQSLRALHISRTQHSTWEASQPYVSGWLLWFSIELRIMERIEALEVEVVCTECGGEGVVNERYVDVDQTTADACSACGGARTLVIPGKSFCPDRHDVVHPAAPSVEVDDSEIPF